jgi:hypothetical protein
MIGGLKEVPQAQSAQPAFVVTARRALSGQEAGTARAGSGQQPKSDIKKTVEVPKQVGPTADQLEDEIMAASRDIDLLPKDTELAKGPVAKLLDNVRSRKRCCEDCICKGECTCAYPGQCLINSATPEHTRVVVTHCHGNYCETRTYDPQLQGEETGKLYKIEPTGTWFLNRMDSHPGQWVKQSFQRAAQPVRRAVGAVIGTGEVIFQNTFRGCAGGNCRSCR